MSSPAVFLLVSSGATACVVQFQVLERAEKVAAMSFTSSAREKSHIPKVDEFLERLVDERIS